MNHILLSCLATIAYASGEITLNYNFGIAYASDGVTPVPDGTLWVMIVDDGDGVLPGGLEANSSLKRVQCISAIASDFNGVVIAKGNFIGNDRIIDFGGMNGAELFDLEGILQGESIYSFGQAGEADFSNHDVGKAIGFYWFPGIFVDADLQLGRVLAVGGISDQTSQDASDRMVVPSDGSTVSPTAMTTDLGGSFSVERFTAVKIPQSGYDVWRDLNFTPQQIAAGEAEPGADPDGDGLANLLEYATGSDPLKPSPSPLRIHRQDEGLALRFQQIADPDLHYRIEASDDLTESGWSDVVFESSGMLNVAEWVDVDLSDPSGRRFFRLRVDLSHEP